MKVSAHELCFKNLPLIKYTCKLNYHVSFYLAESDQAQSVDLGSNLMTAVKETPQPSKQTSLSTTSTSRTELDSGFFGGEDKDSASGDICTPRGHHQDIDNVDIVKMQKVIKVTIFWKMFLINLFIDLP